MGRPRKIRHEEDTAPGAAEEAPEAAPARTPAPGPADAIAYVLRAKDGKEMAFHAGPAADTLAAALGAVPCFAFRTVALAGGGEQLRVLQLNGQQILITLEESDVAG